MAYEDLLFERKGHVATLVFNRPERMNAFSRPLLEGANRALAEAREDPEVRVLVVTGTGRAFCAGADTKAMKEAQESGDGSSPSLEGTQRLAQAFSMGLHGLPKPVIGAINGVAAGAGFEIALACDIRVAAQSARFKEAAMGVGLVAGDGSAWFLPRLVGLARAFEVLLLEEMIDSRRALELGLVNRVVPDEQFHTVVAELAEQLAAKPPLALAMTKKSILDGLRLDLPDLMERLIGMVERSQQTEDHLEGVRARAERRPPNFLGR